MSHDIHQVTVPQLGEGQVEVRILALHHRPGDRIERDAPLYEAETDKAQLDLESPVEGILSKWLVQEGDTVEIGGAVAEIRVATSTAEADPAPKIPPRTRKYALDRGLDDSDLRDIRAGGKFLTPDDIDTHLATRSGDAVSGYRTVELSPRQVLLNRSMTAARDAVVPVSISVELPAADLTGATQVLNG
ncbi:MAG: hypothetical protein J2P18_22190, partial [Nocardia sp.]|nr:hypothetical protein [Nocardia sp.]